MGYYVETYLETIMEANDVEPLEDTLFISSELSARGLQASIDTYGLLDLRVMYCNGSP